MASLSDVKFAALELLLKASSKDTVRHLCGESFSSSAVCSNRLVESTATNLSVTSEEAQQLLHSLHHLIRYIVFKGLTSADEILPLFPKEFHQSLKNLLTKMFLENIPTWRTEAQANQVSLPQMIDFDWRVDVKTASDNINRMAVPSCLLQMKDSPDNVKEPLFSRVSS
ncbi:COMM domain-containing protein 9 isoform X2 [Protopterus annectens]|uniref:COMM domain-containing protein 9 isoform X2 n=1 Tax=Protopterus annectens TaxID=7888 RepID=UPI001CFA9E71|nr:COMM domain-containing protein 9 isoform X2 [Protopterus annectens]